MRANRQARQKLAQYPAEVKQFFADLDEKCKKHRITLELSPWKSVRLESGSCSGLFDQFNRRLIVCLGRGMQKALSIAIHESNHLVQSLDPESVWYSNGGKMDDFFSWLGGEKKYKPLELTLAAIEIEADCERRSLKDIKKHWSHIIDPADYEKKAAAYLYFYLYCYQTRNWSNKPFNKKILDACPAKLPKTFDKIPRRLLEAFEENL